MDTFEGQLKRGAVCNSHLLARGMRHPCVLIPSKMGKSFVYLVRRLPGNSAGCEPSFMTPHEPDEVDVPRSNRELNTACHIIPPFSQLQHGTLFVCVSKHVLYTLLSRRAREMERFFAIILAGEFPPFYYFGPAFTSSIIV